MKTIELSELVADTILSFCENLAELGYRPTGISEQTGPDMWFRYLSAKERNKVAQKLIDIVERDEKRFAKEDKKAKKKVKK